MKYSTAAFALGSAATALAMPTFKEFQARQAAAASTGPTDVQVLQYALTLENLECAMYGEFLSTFSAADFANAGQPDWVRGRMSQIHQHECTHANILSDALGNQTLAPCTYAFPTGSVAAAMSFADFVENLGVSAYSGANQYITDPLYSTVAAVILSVEARHNGFWNGPTMLDNDWTGPFDTPLGLDMVFTLASQVITSCPSSNAALPVMAATPLLSGGAPFFAAEGGDTVSLTWTNMTMDSGSNAFIYNGLGAAMVDCNGGNVTLPTAIQGFSYILISSAANISDVATSNIIAGPAMITSTFGASASNPGFMNPYNS